MTETKPLEGIRVLDFTRLLPGPLGTHLLSALGASITKIESPHRADYVRGFQPKIEKVSSLVHVLNHSKKALLLDYERAEGKKQIEEEIKNCDVLIEQFRPGAMAAWRPLV
ncbi:putative alpha-methylacyl-CoA racemase [Hymenobacter roseosalivarius DSM 11622]|uniref:Putative alpha-methylacyl-CoA racemase n=1 Tax=Hymenobacter roseosalivarius DSM 11622 TaxID=645990 RepID=A0A1W1UGU8_9BACT|nr:CoA transferase [Hymenobacter roseosalivarius]SMB80325.1 putative alpha-methylacyl-CoA racemase [Hymenobacter roseosalivarius DSM 11622]